MSLQIFFSFHISWYPCVPTTHVKIYWTNQTKVTRHQKGQKSLKNQKKNNRHHFVLMCNLLIWKFCSFNYLMSPPTTTYVSTVVVDQIVKAQLVFRHSYLSVRVLKWTISVFFALQIKGTNKHLPSNVSKKKSSLIF